MAIIEEKQLEILHAYGQLLSSTNKGQNLEYMEPINEEKEELERKRREDKKIADIIAFGKNEDDFEIGGKEIL